MGTVRAGMVGGGGWETYVVMDMGVKAGEEGEREERGREWNCKIYRNDVPTRSQLGIAVCSAARKNDTFLCD